MNHIYRSLWNESTQTWVAVSEVARSPGGRSAGGQSGASVRGAGFALKAVAAVSLFVCGTLALANPSGGTVSAGSATISTSGSKVTINQGSQNAAINWQSFSIGSGESVVFVQPNANSVALNRVVGGDASSILGSLSSNGQVFLINPNGILFGRGATVNVQGLVASTLGLSDADFMAGKYGFSGTSTNAVANLGSIVADGGYVALLGAKVSNQGTISARLGSVALAGGQGVTLDIAGDSLLKVNVDQGALNALVENGGLIQADGGQVLMTAQAAGQLLDTVVNNTGVVQAQTVQSQGGVIKLLGDMGSGTVNVGGTLDASAPAGGNGGSIETSAANVKVADGTTITTQAPAGASGTWLIDPKDFTIASGKAGTVNGSGVPSGDISGTTLGTALAAGNVTIESSEGSTAAGSGNILVEDTVAWAAHTLTLTAANNIVLGGASTAGVLTATGAAGLVFNTATANGGDAAVAGGKLVITDASSPTGGVGLSGFEGQVNLATGTSFTMNTHAYTIINGEGTGSSDTTAGDLQGMQGNLAGYYVLGSDIDASAHAFTPIGSYSDVSGSTAQAPKPPLLDTTKTFNGVFEGLGHRITGLTISQATTAEGTGLFGVTGGQVFTSIGSAPPSAAVIGQVSDVHLVAPVVAGVAAVGALVGLNAGVVNNAIVTGALGSVTGANNGTTSYSVFTGGLVGENIYQITGSYAYIPTTSSNTVTSVSSVAQLAGVVGGLVGLNADTVSDSSSGSAVSGFQYVGGLAGQNGGTLLRDTATGAITAVGAGSGGGTQLGGLVGYNSGAITGTSIAGNTPVFSSASGAVTGSVDVGGLVGLNAGSVAVSTSSSTVTGTTAVGGLVGANQGANGGTGHLAVAGSSGPPIVAGTAGSTGLAGFTASITTSYSTGSVTGTNQVGGLVGLNAGGAGGAGAAGVDNAPQGGLGGAGGDATISQSYSTATVSGATDVGGLVGRDISGILGVAGANSAGGSGITVGLGGSAGSFGGSATITDTYSSGGVTGTGTNVGGLVGFVDNPTWTATPPPPPPPPPSPQIPSASVTTSYTTSTVSGGTLQGLAIGQDTHGTYTDAYYELRGSQTAFGSGSSASVSGLTSAQFGVSTNLAGFNFSSVSVDGIWGLAGSAPTLCALTVGCAIHVYVETEALVNNQLVSSTQSSTYGNSVPTFEDVLVTATGALFTLPSGVTETWATTSNLATPTLGGTGVQPTITTNAGSYAVAYGGTGLTLSSSNQTTQDLLATYHYLNYGTGVTWTVNRAQVVVSAPTVTASTYGAGSSATLSTSGVLTAGAGNTIAGTGILPADAASVTLVQAATGTFATHSAGSNIVVSYADSLGGDPTVSANYQLVEPAVTGTINQAPLTVTGTVVAPKTYDGTTTATVSGGALHAGSGSPINTASGVLASDFSNVHLTTVTSGAFACATVAGNCGAVTVADTLTGTASANYVLVQPALTGTISPAALTVTGVTVAAKTYDGTGSATLSGTAALGAVNAGFGVVTNDDVHLTNATPTGTFGVVDAGTRSVTLTDTLTGAAASNYSLVLPVLSGLINPAPLIISGSTANDKTYDGTTAATLSGGTTAAGSGSPLSANANGLHPGDDVTLVQTGTFAGANVSVSGGTVLAQTVVVNDTLSGAQALDYVLTQPASVSAKITPAPLTVSGTSVISKTYDGSNVATLSGGTLAPAAGNNIGGNGVFGADSGNVSLGTASSGTFASASVAYSGSTVVAQGVTATDLLTLSGTAATNYVFVPPTLTGIINPAPLTVTGLSAANKTYDGTTTAQLTGTAALVAAPGNTIGGVLLADNGDVTLVSSPTGTFTTANAGSAPQAVSTTDSLVLSGAATGNYALVQPAALSASIAPAPLVVSGTTVANKTYNGSRAAAVSSGTLGAGTGNLIGTASGVFGGDDVSLVQGGNFASANASANAQPVVSTDTLGGLAAGNYVLTLPGGLTATIAPAPLTVTGTTVATRTYNGGTTATLGGTSVLAASAGNTIGGNGVLGSDSAAVTLVAAPTGTFASANAVAGQGVSVVDTLSGTASGNYVLVQPTLTGTITPAPLTATGTTVVTKTYDGTTTATLQGGTLTAASGNTMGGSGVLSADSGNVTFTAASTGTFASVNAGPNAQAVTVVDGLALAGSAAIDYVFVQPVASGVITPAPLTVSGTSVATKTYDGSSLANLSGGALVAGSGNNIATSSGVLAGDASSLSLVLAHTGTFASVNASLAAQAVGVSDSLSGSAASNYVLVQPALTGLIDPAPLTVSGTTVATRTYNGTTVAVLNGGALAPAAGNTLGGDGVLAGDTASVTLVLAATGNYATADAGANARPVSVNDSLAFVGAAASNYVLVQPTLSGLVTQAPITVTGTTVVAKTYNGNSQATLVDGVFSPVNTGTASTSNTIAGSGVAAGDLAGLVLNQAGNFAGSNASSAAQGVTANDSLGGSAAGNYVLVEPTGLAGTIAPAPLTVGNTIVANKTYNGSNAAVVSGGQLVAGAGNTIGGSGVLSADMVDVHLTTVTSGTFASANASGTTQAVTVADTLSVSGAAAGNYVLVEPAISGTIAPAPLTVTGSAVTSRTYDGTRSATLTGGALAPVHTGSASTSDTIATASGVLAGDASGVTLVQAANFASVNASPSAQAVAANDSLTLSGTAAGNYVLVQPTGLSGVISPAPVTVTGATVVDKTYNGTTTASFTGGTLAPAAGNTIGGSGVVATDASNLRLAQNGNFASANANANPQAVTATDALSGSAAPNYVLVEPTGLAGTISPAPVTVSGTTVATRTYDGTTTATLSGGTLSAAAGNTIGGTGVLSADTAFVSLQTAPSGSFASPNASPNAQSVSVSDTLTLTGSAAGNYVLLQPATLTGFINPAPLTVVGSTVVNKNYDGTTLATLAGGTLAPVNNGNPASSDNIATASGVLASDAASVALNSSGNFASSNASPSSQAVTVHDSLTLTGSAAGNYVLVQPGNLSGVISPATLTITAAANTKTYDGTTAAGAAPIVAGLASGTTLSGVSESYTSANVAGANASTLVVNGGIVVNDGNFGNNYTLVTQGGTGTINPATLTVIDTLVGNKVYDGTKATTVSGGVLVGLFNDDAVTLAQSGSFASANAGAAVALVGSDAISGASAFNYVLQQPTGLTGVIAPAPLTVTGTTVVGKVFDGSTRATLTGGSLVGLVASDAGSVSLDQAGRFTSPVPSSSVPVIAADTLTGSAATNYTLAEPTGLAGNIAPNPLMPTAASLSVPLTTTAGAALADRSAPLVPPSDGSVQSGLTASGSASATAAAAAAAGTGVSATNAGAESNNSEKRRVPALSG